MFQFEALTIAYFAALGLLAPFSGAPWRKVVHVILLTTGVCLSVFLVVVYSPGGVRMWLGHAYLALGYWVPALLVQRERTPRFEAWLVRTDAVWRRYKVSLSRWGVTLLELSYLLCYPAVPLAFAAVWTHAPDAAVDRFWVAVLMSGFVTYGCLPWLVSRPPRMFDEVARDPHAFARFNVAILRRVSHQLNTFPSGHVAVSVAAALPVLAVWPSAGVMLSLAAVGVAIGAVAGRYHYVVDVVVGVAVGIGCTGISRLL